jgi:hypothetical protein
MWVAKGTRLDIQYTMSQLSQHCSEPKTRHWNSVIRVIRYLKGTLDQYIQYGPIGSQEPEDTRPGGPIGTKLQGYSDAECWRYSRLEVYYRAPFYPE